MVARPARAADRGSRRPGPPVGLRLERVRARVVPDRPRVRIGRGFFEEIGWSGFAYRQLRTRRSLFAAAFLLGLGWGVWHLPVVDALGVASPHGVAWPTFFAAFVLALVGLRLIISAAYEATGSLLLAQTIHAASTASLVVFGAQAVSASQEAAWYATYALVLWVVGVALIAMVRRTSVAARAPLPSPFI